MTTPLSPPKWVPVFAGNDGLSPVISAKAGIRFSSNMDLGLLRDDFSDLDLWLGQIRGMCLVTGPTGSGKTTTLYALLHELELSDNAVITIEDPIEYAVDGITQIQVDHAHGLTFAEGLKAMLRLDPDLMLVGEMRDAESAKFRFEQQGLA